MDELNFTETKHTYVFECLPGHGCLWSFRGNLLIVYAILHDSTLKKTFQSKEFFEK